jgi:putative thioredoxin
MSVDFGNISGSAADISVPSLVIQVDASSIRDYLALSEKLPVMLIFVQAGDQASDNLQRSVKALVEKAGGALIALVVDAAASPELAQAFELNQIPSAYGLLKGQPAPLFVGDQPMEQIQHIITKVLEVAKENGLTTKAKVKEVPKELEPSPTVVLAYEAIDKGDYQGALTLYEKALLENPSDFLAEAGLAQVKLLMRLDGQDLATLAGSEPSTDEEILLKADSLIATGIADAGFKLLLGLFEKTPKDAREPIRLRIVEMFLVVGNDNPEVIQARKTLSLLLF